MRAFNLKTSWLTFAWLMIITVIMAPGVSIASALRPAAAASSSVSAAANDGAKVFVIPIHGPVERGLARFVDRGLAAARAAQAAMVVFDLNTGGGRLDAGLELRDLIMLAGVPTTTFVSQRALSAGALIALAGEALYMAPGTSIGAAEPRPLDPKILSAVRAEFESTAEAMGRDPTTAAAMVDAAVVVDGLVGADEILTLTAVQGANIGFIDGVATDVPHLLQTMGFTAPTVIAVEMTMSEVLARWVTHPDVAALFLSLGFLGLVAEVVTPGFGVPGALGLTFLALFFGGHALAGSAGWAVFALLLVGLALLLVEVFVPGFGLFGVAGIGALVASVFFVAPTPAEAGRSLLIALVAAGTAGVILFRLAGGRTLWRRLALGTALTGEAGYTAQSYPRELIGERGEAVTVLRPAGTALVRGRRWDVVTDGSMVPRGTLIVVTDVSGNRILVSPLADGEPKPRNGDDGPRDGDDGPRDGSPRPRSTDRPPPT